MYYSAFFDFYNHSSGLPQSVLAYQKSHKNGKPLRILSKLIEKYKLSERVFLYDAKKVVFDLKSQGRWKMLKPVAGQVIFRPRPIHTCHKTSVESRWNVPLKIIDFRTNLLKKITLSGDGSWLSNSGLILHENLVRTEVSVLGRVTWKLTDIDYPACLSHVEFDYYDTVYNESISKQEI